MVLTIDIGNSFCKAAVMNSAIPDKVFTFKHDQLIAETKELLAEYKINKIAICSVHHSIDIFKNYFSSSNDVFEISLDIILPFKNRYNGKTLGNDRIALIAGALSKIKQKQSLLVIDSGTCVTYDYIDSDLNYLGGAISPGLKMRFKSLHTFTSKLPLIEPTINPITTGTSTEKSIQSGVQNGLVMEIDSMMQHYLDKEKEIKIFLTGGDATLLSGQLKNRFFADPYLTLSGIYNLYLINRNL